LQRARRESEEELRRDALQERLRAEVEADTLGLDSGAHDVDRVQARLRDAARAGAGDEALVEEQLRRRLRLGGGEHRAAPGGAGGEEQARQHLAVIGDRSCG